MAKIEKWSIVPADEQPAGHSVKQLEQYRELFPNGIIYAGEEFTKGQAKKMSVWYKFQLVAVKV